ncbi:type VII toxin-antitoxin system MntA family adenylyltransferase antitoxin [Microbulbifer rhizosphaerae]|uniref:Putative nucleotidyltransferase n=1 Tax=Microbulbifer rhizosphaerae TaxID=1562603 RepID=A0A7W4Z7G1_9GAMM|nr:nucleotidyltransferase domain-containing protein [Microbulbifer rhizosphaerae]MBB3059441.1 putative nucleotidyltransferase [Microbulbifer rhizosphaerae]
MPISKPADQDPTLARIIDRLAKQENLAAVWLYGSRARGTHRQDSDYDIAIALNNFDLPYAERRLTPELIAMDLSAELDHPVQVVDINLVPIPLAVNILDDGKPILVRDELRYCREINRIHGLWDDHCWYQNQLEKELRA